MTCEVVYCIYNKDMRCILQSIRINELCMCEECILVSIPDDELELMKKRLRDKLE